ncbi:biopolymer transporter ExbD, partial [Aliarcobacter butzleri]
LTSTFITRGIIPISLPNASNADNLKPDKEVIIVIQEDGQLMIEDKPATLESIESEILQKTVETPIHINTDKNTRFESFVQVLDMLKKNNYSNVSIVTKK